MVQWRFAHWYPRIVASDSQRNHADTETVFENCGIFPPSISITIIGFFRTVTGDRSRLRMRLKELKGQTQTVDPKAQFTGGRQVSH